MTFTSINLKFINMQNSESNFNKKLELNNIWISYDDVGIGKTPILFLHGFPFNKSMWAEQLDFLKESHRLISIDIRSFGQSQDNHIETSINLFANDLIEFMNVLQLKKVIICGLSMGGFIALNAVKKYPKRFSALILCDTQCIADTAEVKEKRYKTIDEIESTERLAITVKRISDANQNKSKGNTVADLVSTPTTGKTAKWYTIATGGTALNSTDILSKSNYYVEKYSTESVSNRVAVTVDLPPSVSTLSPADDATAITTTSNLVITFSSIG